jgi:hypothetical protein
MTDPADDDRNGYDALDEALMETFPASDPVAVSSPGPPAPHARQTSASDSVVGGSTNR